MTQPAYEAIAEEHGRRIRSGALRPGAQLPSYAEIAKHHHVSDIVVRQAIGLLKQRGLIRSVPRRGVFVAGEQEFGVGSDVTHDVSAPNLEQRIAAIESRLSDLDASLNALRREASRSRVETGALLDHLGIPRASADEIDANPDEV